MEHQSVEVGLRWGLDSTAEDFTAELYLPTNLRRSFSQNADSTPYSRRVIRRRVFRRRVWTHPEAYCEIENYNYQCPQHTTTPLSITKNKLRFKRSYVLGDVCKVFCLSGELFQLEVLIVKKFVLFLSRGSSKAELFTEIYVLSYFLYHTKFSLLSYEKKSVLNPMCDSREIILRFFRYVGIKM